MTEVLITGGHGFLGRNLAIHLRERRDLRLNIFGRDNSVDDLRRYLNEADIVFHLAGINRPKDLLEFEIGNGEFSEKICNLLRQCGRLPKIVFSSSIQAELDNPYGRSKLRAENSFRKLAKETGSPVRIYRLKNLFGKWCRPNYNSVTSTFCYNIARDLPITISDPQLEMELSYVDDVIASFLDDLDSDWNGAVEGRHIPSYRIRLGDLAGRIQAFHELSRTVTLLDFSDWFNRALYATYLSYVPSNLLQVGLDIKSDSRGSLAEFLKQRSFGQVFVSRTNPGVTRGNHFHHTKTEKFLVVEGEGLIRMRSVEGGPVQEFLVRGSDYQVVNIPPGVTHSIRNVGSGEMVTLFWSSEIFDPDQPDTYYLPVDFEVSSTDSLVENV